MQQQEVIIDESRFYANPYALPLPNSNDDPPWTKEQCQNIAIDLLERSTKSYKQWRRQDRRLTLGSLYVGSLGLHVYLNWKLARLMFSTDPRRAQSYVQRAKVSLRNEFDYFDSKIQMSTPRQQLLRGRVTLLEGSYVGVQVLHSVLLYQFEDCDKNAQDVITRQKRQDLALKQANDLVEFLYEECRANLSPTECEVLYGRAGVLQVIFCLRHELQKDLLATEIVVALAKEILEEGIRCAGECQRLYPGRRLPPLLWVWHDSLYLGAAHGVVGILHTLLSLAPSEMEQLNQTHDISQLIRKTIDFLNNDFCYASGNLQSSIKFDGGDQKRTKAKKDRLVHWCHGATGHVLLLVKAYKIYNGAQYLVRAKEIAVNVLWKRGLLRKGVGLCHGIAGNAYGFLAIAQCENNDAFRKMAVCFAKFAIDHLDELEGVPDAPYSLYEGMAALCALVMDLANPSQSHFPMYY